MDSPPPSPVGDRARVPPWRIWLIEIGATAPDDESPLSVGGREPIDRTERWRAATKSADDLARALGSQYPGGLERGLAPVVLVNVPRPLCAATGFVTGVEHGGAPSALGLQVAWKAAA
jgi:hypothetical protein